MLARNRFPLGTLPWLGLFCVALTAAFGAATAHAQGGGGAVYTQTNDPAGNRIAAYRRASNGTLTEGARVSTGGVGAGSTPPFGFPILDSQGGVELTKNGRILFAVNAGDDTISSLQRTSRGLRLVDREHSGGDLPISLDTSGKLLYVLNELSGNITGFRFTRSGQMRRIRGSTESLSKPGAAGIAAQVGFSPGGRVVTVTLRGSSVIDTFRLRRDDTPGRVRPNTSNAATPFGFEYQRSGNLIVSNAGAVGDPASPTTFPGSASSYRLTRRGRLAGTDNVATGQRATCWVVLTGNHRYAFMTNTLSNSVSRFRVGQGGRLRLLGHTPTGPGFPADEALSRNSRYLYVLVPSVLSGASHIDIYRVGSNGALTRIGATPSNLPRGVSGLAAR